MKVWRTKTRLGLWLLMTSLAAVGCNRSPGQPSVMPQLPPPEVEVSLPVSREVTDYEDFPGRTEAISSIEVRARVSGYLENVNFKEGAEVKKGDVLFEIDPRPYQAELLRAEGNATQSDGHLKRLEADYERARLLLTKGSIGREEYDRISGDRIEASGALKASNAMLDMARLNMSYTKVTSPITGRISRRFIDPGNMVKADETILTTVVSLDPIYANFDLDERTTLRLQRLVREKKMVWSPDAKLPVLLGMADEEGYSKRGTINFSDNRVDPDTGTWRVRGIFENPDQSLAPGLFVRIRLPLGAPYRATLVSEQALSTDQGQKFVYVLDKDRKAIYRRVKVGRLHEGLRVITEGLSPGELVVVSGLQRIRQGSEVNPKTVEMPVVSANEPKVSGSRPKEIEKESPASKDPGKRQ